MTLRTLVAESLVAGLFGFTLGMVLLPLLFGRPAEVLGALIGAAVEGMIVGAFLWTTEHWRGEL